MCKCLDKLEERLQTDFDAVSAGKSPRQKTLKYITPQADLLSNKTYTIFYAHIEERKSPIELSVFHNYCPFCGEKY